MKMVNALLRQFIDSNLETLPQGCITNQPVCCFCGDNTDIGGIVLLNHQNQFLKPLADHLVCTNCMDALLQEEERLFGSNPRSTYVTLDYLVDGTSPLQLFTEFLRFKESANDFVLQRVEDNEDLVCYFTGELIGEKDLHYVALPVGGQVHNVTGGILIYSTEVLKNPLFATRLEHYEQSLCNDQCARCRRSYFVDVAEYSYRVATRELGEYLCPSCCISILKEKGANLDMRRFESKLCKACNVTVIPVDVMKAHNNLICLDCMLHRKLVHAATVGDYDIKIYENFQKGEYSLYVYDRLTGITAVEKTYSSLPNFNELLTVYMNLKLK